MASLGYARVSTTHQTLDQQHDALNAAGVDRIFDDKMSGRREDRPGLAALLDYAREGDTVTVVALDRLGRSLSSMIRTIEVLRSRKIVLRSLKENLDYSTSTGRFMAGIFMNLAEYEADLIRERATAAREAAIRRGLRTGPKPKMDASMIAQARILKSNGQTAAEISKTLGVSRATLYRGLGQPSADGP